jgi:hypothetical protein
MAEIVQMSFAGAHDDPSPLVTIYNPEVLSHALHSQILRFGLLGATSKRSVVSGKLKGGSRATLIAMIQSYGVSIEVVPAK